MNINLFAYLVPYICMMIFYCITNYRIDKINDEMEELNRFIRKKADEVAKYKMVVKKVKAEIKDELSILTDSSENAYSELLNTLGIIYKHLLEVDE